MLGLRKTSSRSKLENILTRSRPPIIGTAVIYSIPPTHHTRVGLLIAFYCTQFYLAEGNLIFSLISRNVAGQTKKSTTLAITFVAWAAGNMAAPQVYLSSNALTWTQLTRDRRFSRPVMHLATRKDSQPISASTFSSTSSLWPWESCSLGGTKPSAKLLPRCWPLSMHQVLSSWLMRRLLMHLRLTIWLIKRTRTSVMCFDIFQLWSEHLDGESVWTVSWKWNGAWQLSFGGLIYRKL